MVPEKLGHGVLKVRDLDRSEAFLEVAYEKPRETRPSGQNPFAGREPLAFDAARG